MIATLYPIFQRWSGKGSVYIYSDPHFADSDCKLMDKNWPEPDEQVEMLNKGISKNDTLIILGDIGDIFYVQKLKAGHKVLIMGNHDAGKSNYERIIRKYPYDFPTIEDARIARKNGVIDYYHDFENGYIEGYIDNKLFDEVYTGPLWISEKLVLSHEPLSICADITGNPIALNIHGHDHNCKCCNDGFHFNVCSNVLNYQKVSLNKIIKDGLLSNVNSVHREIIDNASKNS